MDLIRRQKSVWWENLRGSVDGDAGVCEALAYGQAEGLDLEELVAAVSTGAAASTQLSTFAPKIIAGDCRPSFFLKHIVKDLKLANERAMEAGLTLEVLRSALENYEALEAAGFGNEGTQALFRHYMREIKGDHAHGCDAR